MTNDKENYIGKQCVENKEANEIFSFLEGQMSNFSAQFNGMCKKVTYSIFASSWATIFALRDNEYRIWLLITILLCTSNPQPIGFRGNLLVKRQKFFYCTYSLGITETS